MSRFQVSEKCNGCLGCVQNCPARALEYRDEGDHRTILHNVARCARCATCYRVCPQHAVEFQHLLEGGWDEVVTLAMVRCRVCGEPVYSERLPGGVDAKLKEFVQPLCPRHRARAAGLARRSDAAGERGVTS
jgi:formate hydrogenlyase subunit 6/NADH:ubiquinone oxidoreductase subunit I